MRIQTREETEDFFHDIIAMILPDIDKSNIRPAYQKTKQPQPTGMNYVSQDGKSNGIMPFGNTDNFVYFYVRPDVNSDAESEVSADNQTTFIRIVNVLVYCYGEDSMNNALKLKALMRSQDVQYRLNYNGYYQLNEGFITPTFEDINGEWWERNDVEFYFTCKVDFDTPPEKTPVIAKEGDIISYVDGGER